MSSKEDKLREMVLMKIEARLALETFRKKYDLLLDFVKEYNLNAKGIHYIIDNGYLESDEIPDIESDMKLCTMRIDYEYDINEKECFFVILFKCEVCGFEESLKQEKQFADVES